MSKRYVTVVYEINEQEDMTDWDSELDRLSDYFRYDDTKPWRVSGMTLGDIMAENDKLHELIVEFGKCVNKR